MITPGEIASMNEALSKYEKYEAAVWAVFYDQSLWNVATYSRMHDIAQSVTDNKARFYSRRDELVEMDPTDHEAVLAFVSGIADITGTKMAAAMAAEVQAKDPRVFISKVAQDTWDDLKGFVVLAVVGLAAVLILTRKG